MTMGLFLNLSINYEINKKENKKIEWNSYCIKEAIKSFKKFQVNFHVRSDNWEEWFKQITNSSKI